jgi:ATP-dependent RNA helicase DDX10/DBP4
MGFTKALNAILGHLPKSRQTLLFSATQTESIKDVARLSLTNPEMVGVKEEAHDAATPKNLAQHYLLCTLDKKLDTLFSFIKTHLEVKAIVFLSSCKQVLPFPIFLPSVHTPHYYWK